MNYDRSVNRKANRNQSDAASRQRYVYLAQQEGCPNIVALWFYDVELDLAKHNCRYRAINGGPTIADMILYSYRKKFAEPARTEGFSKILKIPFVPKFGSDFEERFYSMFLPS